ncbi:eukaryotic translation initiation factor 2C [Entomortierella parvispora]|uniref:Eukaryotic translation initiation factor 2C n=1 Tax=Entomortierella parvispora TaxID=205924 RepID=A0A9P3H355_9FUNG|nr:eukaryotic translation initiation factor 2C [Entomortierella parvispora]
MSTAAPIHLTDVVKRPDVGTAGNKVQVRTNFFEVTNLPTINIHHYDVTISPDVPPPVNRKIFSQFIEKFRVTDLKGVRPVYDGRKNMFSAKSLPFDSKTFEIVLSEDVRPNSKNPTPSFKVKIKKAAEINLEELSRFLKGKSALSNNCLTAIMALDVLIHHEPAMLYQTVGRSFFTPAGSQPLSGGLDVWRGYYQSVRPTSGRMMVNVDVSATAFFQAISLPQMVVKILDLRNTDDLRRSSLNFKKVERVIKGLRIRATHRQLSSKTFKIFGLTNTSAKDTVFNQVVNGKDPNAEPVEVKTNVAAYFKTVYNVALTFPGLPCVIVGRTAMLPLEVCEVVQGQRYHKKLDEKQTADMIKFTCQPPAVRANNIRDGLRILNYDRNDFLKDFGLKVSSEMATIQARILPVPTINYNPASRDPNIRPQFGAWNLIGKKVLRGAKLSSWGVIVFGTEQYVPKAQITAFVRELVVTCNDTGMNIVNKTPPIMYCNPHGDIEAALKDIWTRAGNAVKLKPELIMCILPTTGVPLYAEIKRVTDTVLGISSQCIQTKHTRDAKKQYCANVCLKMNVKLGGINSQLAPKSMPFLEDKPTIFFGADVTHPGPGDTIRPSIACLTASMDGKAARYAAAVRTQTSRQETMADLAEMAEELLRAFFVSNRVKPERILFYRDGVAEGQFAEVMRVEVAALKQAFAKLEAAYKPKLTFVVVQKRHHARFFPMNRDGGDRSGNCLPGTVVDTGITHPFEFDFYLQSHGGLLGTSRPAHYCVLHDENSFKADQLQDISYKLCHLYARCTRTVSMVPPAYYAHLIAARARFHARGENWSDSYSTDTTLSDGPAYARVPKSLTGVMWFM